MKRLLIVLFLISGCTINRFDMEACREMCKPHTVRVCTPDKCECVP